MSVNSRDTPVIELRAVSKAYRSGQRPQVVLHAVDLTVPPGHIVGVSGASGTGKSTLLRLAGAIEAPDSGDVRLLGVPAWSRGKRTPPRPGFVMPVFQHPVASLDARWPVWRSVTEPLFGQGRSRLGSAQRKARATAALDQIGLDGIDPDSRPGELSVGQCQRVAIARALIAEPGLIIADEPTSALDMMTAKDVRDLLRATADAGTAIIVASHDRAMLAAISDHLLHLIRGELSTV